MFSNLPPEVISDHIFPFLHVNDLLRLRRVCKLSKELADDYLRFYRTSRKVVILHSHELADFLALTHPIALTRFYIANSHDSWGSEQRRLFLRLHGENITHLKIHRLVIPIKRSQFFERLPNLKELSILVLREDNSVAQFAHPDLNLPSTFKRLKHLHVGEYVCCRPKLMLAFLEECSTNLERVSFPRPNDFSRFRAPDDVFERVRRIINTRYRENPDTPNLRYVDLEVAFCRSDAYARSFYELVTTCSAYNVKLQNVDARWIEAMMQLDTPERRDHGNKISRCLMSINNLTPSVFHLELPLLEQILISWTSECSMPEGDFERHPWSNLKHLKLHVYSEHLAGDGERVNVSRLLEFFFHGIRRENLESLNLSFEVSLPYPDMSRVCSSCPNLKKLLFLEWRGSDEDIAQLWGNLPLLEVATFYHCRNLGDAAFIGDDVTRPAILKAKRLKSLDLGGLDNMPGITDNLFISALRHMPLKSLYLGSAWGPVHSITISGLESLLDGEFALTIERFPLNGRIELEGVTDEQLEELEGKFRSSQM